VDLATLILGVTPPAMAILAELGNPVSRNVIQQQMAGQYGIARELAQKQNVEQQDYEANVNTISETIGGIAAGTSRLGAVIPTWIAFTAGMAAVLVEVIVNKYVVVLIICAWITLCGFGALRYFSTLNYYNFAYVVMTGQPFGGRTTEHLMSRGIIVCNILIIFAVLVTWTCYSLKSAEVSKQPEIVFACGLVPIRQSIGLVDTEEIKDIGRSLVLVYSKPVIQAGGRRSPRLRNFHRGLAVHQIKPVSRQTHGRVSPSLILPG
jgi:hypothetical protein